MDGVNIMDLAEWQKIIDFQCDAMPRLDNVLRTRVQKAVKEL